MTTKVRVRAISWVRSHLSSGIARTSPAKSTQAQNVHSELAMLHYSDYTSGPNIMLGEQATHNRDSTSVFQELLVSNDLAPVCCMRIGFDIPHHKNILQIQLFDKLMQL